MKIAFIGLGNMGGPMALNLHKAGFTLSAYDISAASCDALREQGVTIADSAVAAARDAEVVISMLPASQHVEQLYLGENGLLDQMKSGALLIDCSTIAAESSRKVAAEAEKRGIAAIDAPVSGGTGGAIAGTLTFIVGGKEADFERARPILEKMGANIFHAGDAGAGQTAKICNNMLLGILMIGTSEAMSLGVANGLDPKVLAEIMRRSSGGNWALEKYNPMPGVMENVPSSKNYAGGFGVDLMLKDLGLAQENVRAVKGVTPMGALAHALYSAHSRAGNGRLDFSSIIRLMQEPSQGA